MVRKQISLGHRLSLVLRSFRYARLEALGLIFLKGLDYSSFTLGRFAGLFDRRIQRLSVDVKEEFDGVGENYEFSMYGGGKGKEFVDAVERGAVLGLLKEVFSDTQLRVLDVGAGNGRWSREFLRLGYDVTALDISPKMCEHLERTIGKLKVVCGNIESVLLKGEYDLVFSFRSFKYAVDRKHALENVRNSLRKGGCAILEMPNKHNPFYLGPLAVTPILYALTKKTTSKIFLLADFMSEKEFKADLEEVGFNVVKTKKLFFFPHGMYSKINNGRLIQFFYSLDKAFSKFFPRSIVYVCITDSVDRTKIVSNELAKIIK